MAPILILLGLFEPGTIPADTPASRRVTFAGSQSRRAVFVGPDGRTGAVQ